MTGPPLYLPAVWLNDYAQITPAAWLFRATAGVVSLVSPQVPVFTRAGAAGTYDALGHWYAAPHSMARTIVVDTDNDNARDATALRLDPAATNVAQRSELLSNAAKWVPTNSPTVTKTLTLGNLTLSELSDASATLTCSYLNTVAASQLTATPGALSFFVAKPATAAVAASGARVQLLDGANVRASVTIKWSGTTLQTSAVTGTLVAADYVGLNSDGVPTYRIELKTTALTLANTHGIEVVMAVTAAQTGSVVVGGFQLENGTSATAYIPTPNAANVSRVAETWYCPWNAEPRAATLYLDFMEKGGASQAGTPSLFDLTTSAGADPSWAIESTGTLYRTSHHNGTTAVTSNAPAAPSVGQRVRLRSVLRADGSVQTYQSLDGAAEVAGAASAANALAAAWAGNFTTTRIYLAGPTTTCSIDLLGGVLLFGERTAAECAGYL